MTPHYEPPAKFWERLFLDGCLIMSLGTPLLLFFGIIAALVLSPQR